MVGSFTLTFNLHNPNYFWKSDFLKYFLHFVCELHCSKKRESEQVTGEPVPSANVD